MKKIFIFFKNRFFNVILATVLAVVFLISGLALAQGVPWNSPSTNPPLGNPAGFILANPTDPQVASFNITGSGSVSDLSVFPGNVNLFGSASIYLASGELCFGGTEKCIDFENFDSIGQNFFSRNSDNQQIYTDFDASGGPSGSDIQSSNQAHVILTDGNGPPSNESIIQAFNRDDWIELRNENDSDGSGISISSIRWGDDDNDLFQLQNYSVGVDFTDGGFGPPEDGIKTAITVKPWAASGNTILPGGGYVGIGTEDPDTRLHVYETFNTGYGNVIKAATDYGDISTGFDTTGGYVRLPQDYPLSLEAGSAKLSLAPDANNAYVRWTSGHNDVSSFSLRTATDDYVGSIYGTSGGVFGLKSGVIDDWVLKVDDNTNTLDLYAGNFRTKLATLGFDGLTLTNFLGGVQSKTKYLESASGDLIFRSRNDNIVPGPGPADIRVQLDQTNEKFKIQVGPTGGETDILTAENLSTGPNLFINVPFRYWPDGTVGSAGNGYILTSDANGFASWTDPATIFSGTFLGLTDTPNSYNQPAGWLVGINSAGNGLTFIDPDSLGGGNPGSGGSGIEFIENPQVMSANITGTWGTFSWKDIIPATSVPNGAIGAIIHFTESQACKDNWMLALSKRLPNGTVFNASGGGYGSIFNFVGGEDDEHTGGVVILPLNSDGTITIGTPHGSCGDIPYITVAWIKEGGAGGSTNYDSGWFNVDADNNSSNKKRTLTHNLGQQPNWCTVYFKKSGEADSAARIVDSKSVYDNNVYGVFGYSMINVTSSNLTITVGGNHLVNSPPITHGAILYTDDDGTVIREASGQYKVICGI